MSFEVTKAGGARHTTALRCASLVVAKPVDNNGRLGDTFNSLGRGQASRSQGS